MKALHGTVALAVCIGVVSTLAVAQLYETPEARRNAKDAQDQAEAKAREEQERATAAPGLQEKESKAMEYVGKKYVYVPDASASSRIFFYDRLPASSYSQDPDFQLVPLAEVSFDVVGIEMPPPTVYSLGKDEYLLKIQFSDGKLAYVNWTGRDGLKAHTATAGSIGDYVKEFASSESPDVVVAKEKAAKAKATSELRAAAEKAESRRRAAELAAKREQERVEARRKAEEKARLAAAAAQRAKPNPRLGMTREQVANGTRWGRPESINRTINAAGTHEQWVYGASRYLYFDNDILTTIQD